MPVKNFNFFALSYLNDWMKDDRGFVEGLHLKNLRSNRLKSLQKAANYYKVSRTLKRLDDEERLDSALSKLDIVANAMTDANVDTSVCELAGSLQKTYGKYAVSAASKFLWLYRRTPVVIYDSRAIRCLNILCKSNRRICDYTSYRVTWLAEFFRYAEEIRTACMMVVSVKQFSLARDMSNDELKTLTSSQWFYERVFDKYLWWNAGD
jgi:hypothetical protein